MKLLPILFAPILLVTPPVFGGAYGTLYGPDDSSLLDSGLTVKTSRWEGRTFFQVSLIPSKSAEVYTWFSELVIWKDRIASEVEISCINQQSIKDGISCRFSIADARIEDANFRFQSHHKGNPGLYYELNLKAFMDAATKEESTFPEKDPGEQPATAGESI